MNKNHYIIPIFVPHEGCPHTCVFCNQDSITGSCFKIDGEFVRTTIEEYLKTMDGNNSVIEVSFFGGTFTAINMNKQKELLKIAKEYKDCGRINHIRLSTRPDYIDEEILTNLKKYGVDIIELGVQSLDDEVLIKSGRGHSVEDVRMASELIKEFEFTLGHQIMLGLPGDNFQKDIDTTKKIIVMKPSICRIYPSLVIKNTPMEKLLNNGEYKPYTLHDAVDISKKIYAMLESNDIKVIRIGLQPTEEISYDGDIIDGPFHPSFRELVESSIFSDMITKYYLCGNHMNKIILVNPKDISKLYANKKYYFNNMLDKLKCNSMKVVQSEDIPRGSLGFYDNVEKKVISQKKYMKENF